MTAAAVRITREARCAGEVSPFQYGQFVEYLCNLIPAMWAEQLYDGSFEGLSGYEVAFLPETDFRERPWVPSGAVNRAKITRDPETKVSGEVSLKIAVEGGAPCTVGIAQDGLFVEAGKACLFSCWMRGQALNGPVQVTLHQEGQVYAACEFQPTDAWTKFHARLIPAERDTNAALTISFRGPGTLWLDNASLMPEETVGGWRPDVVEAVRAMRAGIIRFGGSAVETFEWRDTLGDPDRRKPFRAWGGLQPTGPGLEEIVRFCREVGAEPLLCLRVTHRAPEDAAAQVEYFNGAPDTPMGALRAANGHPEPYRIRYWQVANEIKSAEYDAALAAFCAAMKAADPSIRLLSSYPTPASIRNAAPLLDYVCPHHYSQDLPAMEENIGAIRRMLAENAPGRSIQIAVTEWNTTAGHWGAERAMLWTLANALACARYHHLMHRHADIVAIANRSNLINSFCSGVLQTDNHRLYKAPTYYAQQLYATQAGNRPLLLEPPTPDLDMSALLTPDGEDVTLFAINDTLEDYAQTLDFSVFGAAGQEITVWTLADRERAGEPDVTNSFGDPERICTVTSTFHAPSPVFTYLFPALSLTALRWKVSQTSLQAPASGQPIP